MTISTKLRQTWATCGLALAVVGAWAIIASEGQTRSDGT
jgi:hypothetical protein